MPAYSIAFGFHSLTICPNRTIVSNDMLQVLQFTPRIAYSDCVHLPGAHEGISVEAQPHVPHIQFNSDKQGT